MHPLQALKESELNSLMRVASLLFNTIQPLSPGHRPHPVVAGSGIEFLDYRDFSAGDDTRNIDWRSSARSRHPQIRRFREEAAADWFIVLDCSASMATGEAKKWALATQCAAALAYLLIRSGNRAGVILFSDRVIHRVPAGRGPQHYGVILHTLRSISGPDSASVSNLHPCATLIKRHSPVIVISDFLAADFMRNGLDALSIRSGRLIALQILSSQDNIIPTATDVRFECVESGQTLYTLMHRAEQQRYRLAFESFIQSLVNYCRERGIHFSRHQDDEEWHSVLISLFLQHEAR